MAALWFSAFIFFSLQSLCWHHAWPPPNPSQAASATLWLTGAPLASIKQPWSAELLASTPAQQPEAPQHCRSSSEHWNEQSRPLVVEALFYVKGTCGIHKGLDTAHFFIAVLNLDPKSLQWTAVKWGETNLYWFGAPIHSAGKTAVKQKGILNKHWCTFLKCSYIFVLSGAENFQSIKKIFVLTTFLYFKKT